MQPHGAELRRSERERSAGKIRPNLVAEHEFRPHGVFAAILRSHDSNWAAKMNGNRIRYSVGATVRRRAVALLNWKSART
jgi:hypothetical protein